MKYLLVNHNHMLKINHMANDIVIKMIINGEILTRKKLKQKRKLITLYLRAEEWVKQQGK